MNVSQYIIHILILNHESSEISGIMNNLQALAMTDDDEKGKPSKRFIPIWRFFRGLNGEHW